MNNIEDVNDRPEGSLRSFALKNGHLIDNGYKSMSQSSQPISAHSYSMFLLQKKFKILILFRRPSRHMPRSLVVPGNIERSDATCGTACVRIEEQWQEDVVELDRSVRNKISDPIQQRK